MRYPQKWRSYSRRCCATSRRTRTTRQKQQRSRNIAASALVAPQHAGRQQAISSAFRRVSVGDADDAIAAMFSGADIQHVIINFQLWKDMVKVLTAAPAAASYTQ